MNGHVSSKDWTKFLELLEEQYSFPCKYLFKFVISIEHKETLAGLLTDAELNFKHSSNGKFVSVTYHYHASKADEIVLIYERVKVIPGLISL